MIVLNPSGSIESINPAAASMFGASASSLLRRDIGILFEVAPDRGQIETFLARLKAKRSENKGRIQEFFGRRSDGTIFPLEVSVSPVDLADRTSFVAVLRDVSERREVEQMKSEFVATVSPRASYTANVDCRLARPDKWWRSGRGVAQSRATDRNCA